MLTHGFAQDGGDAALMLGVDQCKDGAESDHLHLADQCLPNRVQASPIQWADFATVAFESFREESGSLCRWEQGCAFSGCQYASWFSHLHNISPS